MSKVKPYTIGIDATNLRAGGGVTHLMELLRAAQPARPSSRAMVKKTGGNKTESFFFHDHAPLKGVVILL